MKKFTILLLLVGATKILTAQVLCDSINTSAGVASVNNESVCAGDSVVMEITGFSSGDGLMIQWEESTDTITWNAIAGADTSIYTAYSLTGGDHFYRAIVNCGTGSDTSNFVSVSVGEPMVLSATGDTICGAGNITLQATANTGSTLSWYDEPTGGNMLGSGTNFTTYVSSDTTFYVEAVTGGGSGIMALPQETTTFIGNVRGYWFTAPVSFTITGLRVPNATTDQSIAVVKFVPALPPPTYSTTTNNFVVLYLTQNNTNTGVLPVNISINAGEVIGILGQRGNTTAYANASPYTTYIDGNAVTLTRMGMQYPLGTTAPQDLWQEPTSTSLGLIEMTYSAGCNSARQSVDVVKTPAPPVTITASSMFLCDDDSVTLNATSSNDPNYVYNWYPGQQTGSTITTFVTGTATFVVEAYDSTCFYTDSVEIVMSPPINSFITSSPSNYPAPNCNGTIAAYPTGGVPPLTFSWNSPITNGVCQGWYTVTITDAAGCVKIDSVYVNLVIGIEELNAAGISIFPNPVVDVLTINSEKEIGKVKIYDVVGRLIYHELIKNNYIEINVKEFNSGIYFVEINNSRIKIVKM